MFFAINQSDSSFKIRLAAKLSRTKKNNIKFSFELELIRYLCINFQTIVNYTLSKSIKYFNFYVCYCQSFIDIVKTNCKVSMSLFNLSLPKLFP